MLRELYLRNLAVVSRAALEVGSGLNVLSGETGAGKSIVVDSLALLAGARANADLIRSETDGLSVTGVFEPRGEGWRAVLESTGVEVAGGSLVIRREIQRSGRNRVFVDDQPVTLRTLTRLAPFLLRIHTQREELAIVSPELQRRWLDEAGGDEGVELLAAVAAAWERWKALADRLAAATGSDRERLERIDLLRFQHAEIEAARLEPGEGTRLRRERDLLRHSEAVTGALGEVYGALFDADGAVVEQLTRARQQLQEIEQWESEASPWIEELADLAIRAEEIARAARSRGDAVDADPSRLDSVEERLAVVERLCRKYGATCEDVLAHGREVVSELDRLTLDAESLDELTTAHAAALDDYRIRATELSARRVEWGERLAGKVHAELADLAMGRARFGVELGRRSSGASPLEVDGERVEFAAAGFDQVTFVLAANPGEPMQPLAKVASGGELSRIYLALQLAVPPAAAGEPLHPTLVFDEVDSGIGGAEAAALGEKLLRLSHGGQILVVTHLPQVASHGHRHFRVAKQVSGGRTEVEVERLEGAERVEEVARMLAGREVTDLSRSHAEELIAVSHGEVSA